MKNLMPHWPPKWWYLGTLTRRNQSFLLVGAAVLAVSWPFFVKGARQARMEQQDRTIRILLATQHLGGPASQLDILYLEKTSSFDMTQKKEGPDLYFFMAPNRANFALLSPNVGKPNLKGYNVRVIPLPLDRGDDPTCAKAIALGLVNKSKYDYNQLEFSGTLSLSHRVVPTNIIEETWGQLNNAEIQKIQSALATNQAMFEENRDYPIFIRVGNYSYKLKNPSSASRILLELKGMSD